MVSLYFGLVTLTIVSTVYSNVCQYEHLTPADGSPACTPSQDDQQGSCQSGQYCVTTWSGGVCCENEGGKKPVCPNGGTLQHAPLGAACATDANCNTQHDEAHGAVCTLVDPRNGGYQNAAGTAKFCCTPRAEDVKGAGQGAGQGASDPNAGGGAGAAGQDAPTTTTTTPQVTTPTTTPTPAPTTTTPTPAPTTTTPPPPTTTLQPTVPKTCVWSHLEPAGGAAVEPKRCTFSLGDQKGSCQPGQFCISTDAKEGICCQHTGGRPPACPWGGGLQYAPMGVLCLTDANCNLNGESRENASRCIAGDARGYQNEWGTARFCCIPYGGGVPTVLAVPMPVYGGVGGVPMLAGAGGMPTSYRAAPMVHGGVYSHMEGGHPYQYNAGAYPQQYFSGYSGVLPGFADGGGIPLLARGTSSFGLPYHPSFRRTLTVGGGAIDPLVAGALTGQLTAMGGVMPGVAGSLTILAKAEAKRLKKKGEPKPKKEEAGGSALGALAGMAMNANPYVAGAKAALGVLGGRRK